MYRLKYKHTKEEHKKKDTPKNQESWFVAAFTGRQRHLP